MVWEDRLSVKELTEMKKKTPRFPSRERNFAMRRRGARRFDAGASPIGVPPPPSPPPPPPPADPFDRFDRSIDEEPAYLFEEPINDNLSTSKNCTSCKCPREDHDVCHEEWASVRSRLGLKADESSGPLGFSDPRERGLAWAPPGLPPHKVDEYFSMLPEISVPRLGTPGERHRDRQLAFQLPKQDLARAYCRYLDLKHASSADDFMAARNEIALDIGTVQEVDDEGLCCGACQESLKYGSLAVSASKLGLLYHPACFRCTDCKELLVDLAYCVHEDVIFCERHYAEQLKPRCSACDEVSTI